MVFIKQWIAENYEIIFPFVNLYIFSNGKPYITVEEDIEKHLEWKLRLQSDIGLIILGGAVAMNDYKELFEELMADPVVKKEYDAFGPELQLEGYDKSTS